jgi:hypothetical protein
MIYKIDPEFGKQIADWICSTSVQHVMLCAHEGCHLLFARIAGYEPEVYGPRRTGRTRTLGSVDSPPPELLFNPVIAKFYLGPSMIEDIIFGENHWEQIGDEAQGDFEKFRNWKYRIGNPIDQYGEEVFSVRAVRKSVYADFARAEFRILLINAAREYERRVFSARNALHRAGP